MSDLRERRRQETERSIQNAALQLAARQGVDAVTVEAICAAAGVSVRTFFNYFPFKEAAFAVSPPPFDDNQIRAFVEGEGPLIEGLAALFAVQIAHLGEDRQVLRILRESAQNHPRVSAMQIARMHAFEAELAALIARRMGRAAPDRRCRVVAAAATAAVRATLEDWAETSEGDVQAALREGLSALDILTAAGTSGRPAADRA
jgi:AcrR family transcriptional regulator